MLVVGFTINSPSIVGSPLVTSPVKYNAKVHLMLMSELYFVHRLHSPHSNGDVGKAAFSAALWVELGRDLVILR